MLRLPPFEYHAPSNIAEAVALKAELGDSAMYSAGGTDLFPNMKRRQFTPQNLIGLADLGTTYHFRGKISEWIAHRFRSFFE